MGGRADDAFGDLLDAFLRKERERETRNGSNRLHLKRMGGRGRGMLAIVGKRAAARAELRTPGWFVRFMFLFQIAMIYFVPSLAILVSKWSGNDAVVDKIVTCLFLLMILLAQMLTFMVTMMRAISSGVFALGYIVLTFLCSYYLCVFAYVLSMGGLGGEGSHPPFLRRIGFSSETSISVAVFSVCFDVLSLLLVSAMSFCDSLKRPDKGKFVLLIDRPKVPECGTPDGDRSLFISPQALDTCKREVERRGTLRCLPFWQAQRSCP